jgi:methylglyoxal synthase
MIELTFYFDPADAEDDDPTDLGVVERLAEVFNVEMARMSSAYQGYRVEEAEAVRQ